MPDGSASSLREFPIERGRVTMPAMAEAGRTPASLPGGCARRPQPCLLMSSLYRRSSRSLESLCASCQIQPHRLRAAKERDMLDLVMVALGACSFALLGAYAVLCARL